MFRGRLPALAIVLVLAAVSTLFSAPRWPDWPTAPAREWFRVRSAHFVVCGDVSLDALREVTTRLEQFRAVLARVLPGARVGSGAPTAVVVFSTHKAFEPFKPRVDGKPVRQLAGFFVSSAAGRQIALTLEAREEPYPIIHHEFTHQVLASTLRRIPAWLGEGMAEFYSSFAVASGDKRAILGRAVDRHVLLLRQRSIPLARLFEVRQNSPEYTDPVQSPLFYGESWALVHYLMIGSPERSKQLSGFLNRVEAGIEANEAVRAAFGIDTRTLEEELRQYVRRPVFQSLVFDFDEAVAGESLRITEAMGEAEVEAILGGVLFGLNRLDEAETRLVRAIRLDPNLGGAHSSLGWLRLRQNRDIEALAAFEKGAELAPGDLVSLAAFGSAAARVESAAGGLGALDAETRGRAREALERAVTMASDDSGALTDLAFLLLVDRRDLTRARTLLERAMAAAPGDTRPPVILAQVRLAQGDAPAARALLLPLTSDGINEATRELARQLLERIDLLESQPRKAGR